MPEEYKGKKLLRIVGGKDSVYSSNAIKFALVSKPEGGVRKQVTPFYSCRDYINDTLRACVHGMVNDSYYAKEVDLTKLRLLIGKSCKNREERYEFKEKIFSAKRLLNFYENVAGWESPSVIATVRMEGGNTKIAWLLTGPEEWLRYSHLTSMVTLLFRIISKHGPIEFTDLNSIEEWFEELIAKFKDNSKSGVSHIDWDVNSYLPNIYKKLNMLMKYHKELFIDPPEKAYPKEGSVHGSGGINSLCSFSSGVPALNKRMGVVWEKYERERQERVKKRTEKKFEVEKGVPSL